MKSKLSYTKNYGLFESHPCNRDTRDALKLRESMEKYGFLPSCAIHVRRNGNGKFKVIRGHNRIRQAESLGIGFYYIEDDSDVSIFELEADSRQLWSVRDFVAAYIRAGYDDYRLLNLFARQHGLNIGSAAALISAGNFGMSNSDLIKSGEFKVGNMAHGHDVAEVTDLCVGVGIDFARTGAFVAAVSAALRLREVCKSTLMARIQSNPTLMRKSASWRQYIEELERVYNYRSRDPRIPIAHLAVEDLRERRVKAMKKVRDDAR